jgi:hypothetical protein
MSEDAGNQDQTERRDSSFRVSMAWCSDTPEMNFRRLPSPSYRSQRDTPASEMNTYASACATEV